MMKHVSLRNIAVKIVTTAMVTVMVMGSMSFVPTQLTEPIGVYQLQAASEKFPAINNKIYQLIDKSTLDFNPANREVLNNPLYAHLMSNINVTNVLDNRKGCLLLGTVVGCALFTGNFII